MISPKTRIPKHRANYWIGYFCILLVAVLFRLLPINSGLPYSDYVDEGHVLHQTIDAFHHRNLDVYWYGLPALPAYSTGAALLLYSPFYRYFHGHAFQQDLPKDLTVPSSKFNYDLITPVELIKAGRSLTAAASILTVIIAGMIARRLVNPRVGLFAMLLTAVCPALVTRASIVIVDTFAAFFAVLTVYQCLRLSHGAMKVVWRDVTLAGVATGLTFASKYPVAVVGVAVLTRILSLPVPWQSRIRLIALASGGTLLGILVGAPMTFIKPFVVWRDVVENVRAYSQIPSAQGYIAQAISLTELGLPVLLIGSAGIIVLLSQPGTRTFAVAWLLFGTFLVALFLNSSFRPFRSFLSLVPLLCIAAAVVLSHFVDWALAKKDVWWRSAITIALLCGCIGPLGFSSWQQIRRRMVHQDARIQAVSWLQARASSHDTILAIRELMILPTEWQRIAANVTVIPWFEALDSLEHRKFDYIVTGEFDLRYASDPNALEAYRDRWLTKLQFLPAQAVFGQVPTPVVPYLWRTNDERIRVLKNDSRPSRQASAEY